MVLIIGITGPSGAGKSTLAHALKEAIGKHDSVIISQDDYYKDLSHIPIEERKKRDFDHPSSIDFDLLAENLIKLKKGEVAEGPCYDFRTHTRKKGEKRRIKPAKIIIVEGLLICTSEEVKRVLDFIVYVHASTETRFKRRLRRDIKERGRTKESVIKQWQEKVEPAFKRFIEPIKEVAHIVVDAEEDVRKSVRKIVSIINTLE